MTLSDISETIIAYCTWNRAIPSNSEYFHFLDQLLHHSAAGVDLSACSLILHALPGNYLSRPSVELDEFVHNTIRVLNEPSSMTASKRGRALVNIAQCLYKVFSSASSDDRDISTARQAFQTIESQLVTGRIIKRLPPSKLAVLGPIFCKSFGLVHPDVGVLNFGPCDIGNQRVWEDISTALIKNGMRGLTIREVARLGEGYACMRFDNREFWSSWLTVLESQLGMDSDGGSELSPEELSSVAFTIAEMDLSISSAARNQITMLVFEKINLMEKYFNYILFFFDRCYQGDERMGLIRQMVELIDMTDLGNARGSVLGNMILSESTSSSSKTDPSLWLENRSVIHPDVLEDIADLAEERWGPVEVDASTDGHLVDITVTSKKIAILIHSPLQLIGESGLTGTALLRADTARRVLPTDWEVGHICSVEWVKLMDDGDVDARKRLVEDLFTDAATHGKDPVPPQDVQYEEEPESETEDDLSPYIQKDRLAAHRRRMPPSTALPWVSSVFSLRQRPRRRRRASRV